MAQTEKELICLNNCSADTSKHLSIYSVLISQLYCFQNIKAKIEFDAVNILKKVC